MKYFSGKFGRIRANFLRTSKKLPAPTPMQVGKGRHVGVGRSNSGASLATNECLKKQLARKKIKKKKKRLLSDVTRQNGILPRKLYI